MPPPNVFAPSPRSEETEDQGTYVPTIDGIRGLAVISIVLFHCFGALGKLMPLDKGPLRNLFWSGYFGVDVLFIVSGFVLFLPVVLQHGKMMQRRRYWSRRAARIVPAFIVATVFSYLVARSLHVVKGGVGAWASHLLFLHQYSHQTSEIGFGVNGAMWTMSVEVVFYILLPFVAAWFYRRPGAGLCFALAISQFWHLLSVNLSTVLGWTGTSWSGVTDAKYRMAYAFPSYVGHFAIGMTAAWLFVRARDERPNLVSPQLASAAVAASVLGLFAIAQLRGWQDVHNTAGPYDPWVNTLDRTLLFGVLVLAMPLATARVQWIVRNRVSRALGTVSYGIYLSHLPIIALLIHGFGLHRGTHSNTALVVLTVIVLPVSIGVGIWSFRVLEDPVRRWVRDRETTPARPERTAPRQRVLAGAQEW